MQVTIHITFIPLSESLPIFKKTTHILKKIPCTQHSMYYILRLQMNPLLQKGTI